MKIFTRYFIIISSITLSCSTFLIAQEYISDANTIALWHLNETSGTTIYDAGSFSNHGTTIGTTVASGRFGNARNFNGVSDRITIPSSSSLNVSPYLTLEAWINPTAFSSGPQQIVRKNGPDAQNGYLMQFKVSGTAFDFAINTKWGLGTDTPVDPSYFLDGNWHHVAGTYDGTTARVYFDGILVDQDLFNETIGTNSTDQVSIGANDVYGEYFNGLIDEVRISDKVRQLWEFNIPGSHYGSISGVKFNDWNKNGTKDVNEPGISNWNIYINGKVEDTTVTDINGFYEFTHLDSGSYVVTEEAKVTWKRSVPVTGQYDIFLSLNDSASGINFGNYKVYPYTPTTSQIWMDVTDDQGGLTYPMMFGNHINATIGKDSLSPAIMEKEAPPCPPSLCANWQSPRGGHPWGVGLLRYDFRGIPTNETKVDTFVLYAKNTAEPSADIKIRWPVSSYLGQRCDSMFMVEKDDKIPRVNMFQVDSLIIPDAGVQGISELYIYKYGVNIIDSLEYLADRVISGIKFHDLNHNGIKELYEPGIANWRIDLSGRTSGSTYTDNNGFYSFTHVDTGSYTITEEVKDGWLTTVPVGGSYTVYMGLDDIALNLPFGNFNLGKISGNVFNDVNGNRGKDVGEGPVSGFKIRISGAKVDSTLSDETGHYEFKNLLWGSYVVSEALQEGWITTYPIQGSYSVNITYGGQIIGGKDFGSYAGGCMTVFRGWNIISLPVKAENAIKSDLFPGAISDAYKYNGAYVACDTLKNGIGYWLKFPESQRICIPGMPNLEDSVQLVEGWNLIGSISIPLDFSAVQTVPPDLISSPLWEYNQSYNRSDTITPGQGYWVKVTGSGKLHLSGYDQFTSKARIVKILDTELPPPPPEEVELQEDQIPSAFALHQNYPNPFNPTTIIKYDLPEDSWVALKVYNILGHEVMNLVDEMQRAGYKSVKLDCSDLPSGLYFYQLTAGDFIEANKMIHLK